MPARALWKGVISFSGLSLPVKLYPCVKDTRVHFRLLHAEDGTPLEQVWVCSKEGRAIDPKEIVKGAEVDDGRFVLVKPEELQAIEPESDRSVEVRAFVDAHRIDRRYYNRPYYVGPDGSESAFASLREALRESGRVAICQWVMHKRSYLGVLEPLGPVLCLVTLHYRDEVMDVDDLDLSAAKFTDRELTTAGYLIRELTDRFEPETFKDEHQERLRALLEEKAKGKKPRLRKPKQRKPTGADEIMHLLEASVAAARGGSDGHGARRKASASNGKGNGRHGSSART